YLQQSYSPHLLFQTPLCKQCNLARSYTSSAGLAFLDLAREATS
ncbi:hypothetical protein Zm00014a_014943, partial [Zea mays]